MGSQMSGGETVKGHGAGVALHGVVKRVLVESIKGMTEGTEVSDREVDALTRICMMGVTVDGTENPRELMRDVTDPLLDHVVRNRDQVRKNPVIGKIQPFFLIEWCYRNGHLKGDWVWRWDGPKEGQLHYNPRTPLEKVSFPDP